MPIHNTPISSAMSAKSLSASEAEAAASQEPPSPTASQRSRNRRSLPSDFQRELPPLPSFIPPVPDDQMDGLMAGSGPAVDRRMAALTISPPRRPVPLPPPSEDLRYVFSQWPEGTGHVVLDQAAATRLVGSGRWTHSEVLRFLQWTFTQQPVELELTPSGATKLYEELAHSGNEDALKYVLFIRTEEMLTEKAVRSALARSTGLPRGIHQVGSVGTRTPAWQPYMLCRVDASPAPCQLIYMEEDINAKLPNSIPALRLSIGTPRSIHSMRLLQPAEHYTRMIDFGGGMQKEVTRLYLDTDQGQMFVLRDELLEWGGLRNQARPERASRGGKLANTWMEYKAPRDSFLNPPPPMNLFRNKAGQVLNMTIIAHTGFEDELNSWRVRPATGFNNGTLYAD